MRTYVVDNIFTLSIGIPHLLTVFVLNLKLSVLLPLDVSKIVLNI